MNKPYKEAPNGALTSKSNSKPRHKERPTRAQSQIESQLSTLFNVSQQRASGRLADLRSIGEEEVGHINVHRNSKSKLGYLLSTAALHEFHLFGKRFSSIDSMSLYYRSHCTVESLPTASAAAGADFNRNRVKKYPAIKNIFVVICLAYVDIFKRSPALVEALNQNTLPLDSYSVVNGERQRHAASGALVLVVQEAHRAVREKREPDLSKFMFADKSSEINVLARQADSDFYSTALTIFSPSTVREEFERTEPELAQKLKAEEQARSDERRNKKPKPPAEVKQPDQPVDLGNVIEAPTAKAETVIPASNQIPIEGGEDNKSSEDVGTLPADSLADEVSGEVDDGGVLDPDAPAASEESTGAEEVAAESQDGLAKS